MKLVSVIVFAGLFVHSATAVADRVGNVVAVVNGKQITTDTLNIPGAKRKIDFSKIDGKQKKQIIDSLINQHLILEEARMEGFDKSEQMAKALKALSETFIVKQYMAKVALGFDIGDKAVKDFYIAEYSNSPIKYKVLHILLTSEEEAKGLIMQLKKGAGFAALAKEKSRDMVSAQKGGDLGWLTTRDMGPSFAKTVSGLKKSEIVATPTKTQFGWHIIKLDDKREKPAPPFAKVKEKIRQKLLKQKLTDYLANLKSKADIEIKQ